MTEWFRNVYTAVATVVQGMLVTLRVFGSTYDQKRRTFTEHFEYPELPAPVAARYRGFHRYDLTTCIACDQCSKACPVDCIYIGKERVTGGKGFQVTGFTIDYSKCMFCALCVEPCPVDCIFMGSTLDLSCYSRDGTIVDFARLPVDVAWGRSTLNRGGRFEGDRRSRPRWSQPVMRGRRRVAAPISVGRVKVESFGPAAVFR
jgi:NADH-quinone oxidoreductase subunit I